MGLLETGVRLVVEGAGQFQQTIDRASNAVNDFGSRAGSAGATGLDRMSLATVALGTALGQLASQALNAAGSALTNFVRSGWEYNTTLENARAQLVAFTGSQEAANEALAIAERRASRTPFALSDYAQSLGSISAIQRQNGGELEDYLDLVERLAASNPEQGFAGAAIALREAFSGDFISLQDRFNIPKADIQALKDAGFNVENLSNKMNDLGFSTSLVTGLSETFGGRLSTLLDTITQLSGAFMAPIFGLFSEGLAGLQIGLDENIEAWKTWATGIGQSVADSFQTFWEAWSGQWEDDATIQPVHRFVGRTALILKSGFDKIAELIDTVGPSVVSFWDTTIAEIEDLKTAWAPFNRMVDEAGRLFEILGGFIGDVVEAFTGVKNEGTLANEQLSNAKTIGELLTDVFNNTTIEIMKVANWLQILRDRWNAWVEAASSAAVALTGFIVQGVTGVDPAGIPGAATPPGETGPNVIVPIPPPPPTQGNRGQTNVSVNVVVPPGTSPAVAATIVTDGLSRGLRAQGLA